MKEFKHKFSTHQIDKDAEIIILGTYVFDFEGTGDFYYGKEKSFLWHILPTCYNEESLKEADLPTKKAFMQKHKIDFIDVVGSLELDDSNGVHLDDSVIDSQVLIWNDVIAELKKLKNLKAVYFTRKTFSNMPAIKERVGQIVDYCVETNIRFCKLETPSKYFDAKKQTLWKRTLVEQTMCLRF